MFIYSKFSDVICHIIKKVFVLIQLKEIQDMSKKKIKENGEKRKKRRKDKINAFEASYKDNKKR